MELFGPLVVIVFRNTLVCLLRSMKFVVQDLSELVFCFASTLSSYKQTH